MASEGDMSTSGTQLVPVAKLKATIAEMLKGALSKLRADTTANAED